MATRGTRLDWLIFLALGFFWGSSYLFIKIGVDHGLQPFTLITFRLLIGFSLLAVVVAVARQPLPRDPRRYGHLAVMGTINIAIPFGLITFAEQTDRAEERPHQPVAEVGGEQDARVGPAEPRQDHDMAERERQRDRTWQHGKRL